MEANHTHHRVRWFVVEGGERYPRAKGVIAAGYDATCSCGWDSRTGGAVKAAVKRAVREHKWDVEHGFWNPS